MAPRLSDLVRGRPRSCSCFSTTSHCHPLRPQSRRPAIAVRRTEETVVVPYDRARSELEAEMVKLILPARASLQSRLARRDTRLLDNGRGQLESVEERVPRADHNEAVSVVITLLLERGESQRGEHREYSAPAFGKAAAAVRESVARRSTVGGFTDVSSGRGADNSGRRVDEGNSHDDLDRSSRLSRVRSGRVCG